MRIVALACLTLAGCSQQPQQPQTERRNVAVDNPLGLKMDEAGAVGACMTREEQDMPVDQMAPERRRVVVGCLLGQAAEQIRPQLPQQVDPMTRLTNVTAEGAILTYHQSVDVDVATIPPGAIAQLESRVRATVCAQPEMRSTISYGGGYAYRWIDKNGRPINDLTITDCTGVGNAGAAPAPVQAPAPGATAR